MISFVDPTSFPPMKTAGTGALHPNFTSAFSISLQSGSWSIS
ncbi:uncharacterized protein LOC111015777 [Momordica charantia]|uniref:Uncharacterized protein LOC111015777 n=1 Tax=Momordica charantia TaxID=3673 RepID=A0A6J1CYL9_MOMCH|nr:uncharacterized protein LOC111015777 [Momordica charantia]